MPQPLHPVPWWAMRALVPQLRAWAGESAVMRALLARPLVALTLRGLLGHLPVADREHVDRHSAQTVASLPNAHINAGEIVASWAEALRDLLASKDVGLVALDGPALDAESLHVLRILAMELEPGPRPRVILGQCGPAAPADAGEPSTRGSLLAFARVEARRALGVLAALPCTACHEGNAAPSAEFAGGDGGPEILDPLDDGSELRAWDALAGRAAGIASENMYAHALAGLRAAFGCFGFTAALPIAHAMLETWPEPDDAAEIHALLALSAHYIEPLPEPGSLIDDLTVSHLSAALERERELRRRVALGYRLAIHHGRVRGDATQALAVADAAIEELARGSAAPAERALLELWSRNARAYALHRLGRRPEAAADCEAALTLSRSPHREAPFGMLFDVARWHLLTNLARVAFLRADGAAAHAWMAEWEACDRSIPEPSRPPYTMVPLDYIGTGLEATAARLANHAAHARRAWQPVTEAALVEALGHALIRLGRASEACAAYARAKQLFELLGASGEAVLIATINGALSAQRAGLLDEAADAFAMLLEHPLCEAPETHAELEASLAALAALRGERTEAERRMARALALVDGCGAQESLATVLRVCGEARLALRDPAGARATLERARAVCGDGEAEVSAAELLAVHVGLLEARADGAEASLADALRIVPGALHDVNGWWSVPPLLVAALRLHETVDTSDVAVRRGLERLVEAGLQRSDSRAAADVVKRRFGLDAG